MEKDRRQDYEHTIDLLPRKRIAHIPSNVDTMRRQIITLFDTALDLDGNIKES